MRKKENGTELLPGLLFSFVLFVFAPGVVYFVKENEYWFSINDLIPYLILFAVAIFVLITILSLVLPQRISVAFRAGIYACSFLIWLQMIISDQISEIPNMMLWAAVIILFIVLTFCLKDEFRRIVKTTASVLLVLQVVTVGYLVFQNRQGQPEEIRFLSQKDEMVVSSSENTLVFVPEAFDGYLMDHLINKYPDEVYEIFQDFTFYPDTVAGVSGRKYSIPYLLIGDTNKRKESYTEYIVRGEGASCLIQELAGDKYSTGIYTSGKYVDLSRDDVMDNMGQGVSQASSRYELTKLFMKMTASKIVPSIIKPLFRTYSLEFEKWKKIGNNEPYGINDAAFYQKLTDEGITASIEKPCFRFYHMSGMSQLYSIDRNVKTVTYRNGVEEEQAFDTLHIIAEYIVQLKKLGVYDQATIIIMANVGSPEHSDKGHCPLLMIKLPGVSHSFETSDISLSYSSMPDILKRALQGELASLEQWNQTGLRYFYDYSEKNGALNLVEYANTCKGIRQKLVPTGSVYHGKTSRKSRKYVLNTEVFFDARATAEDYQVSGFYEHEDDFTWTSGNNAEMLFELYEIPGDLEVALAYRTFGGMQSVGVWANDKLVDIYYAEGETEQIVMIPASIIAEDKKLRLRVELPDACSPAELGQSEDTRELALAMKSLVIREAEME